MTWLKEGGDETGMARYAIARAHATLGNYSGALAVYEELHEMQGDSDTDIGRMNLKLGNYQEAKAAYAEMLDRAPHNPFWLYDMALAESGLGNRDRAMDLVRRALNVWRNADPGYRFAVAARDSLTAWTTRP